MAVGHNPPPSEWPRASRPGRPAKTGRNASALVYEQLRADITSLRRKPGEALVERDISAAFGISRTPVREALLRLAADNLVDIFPQSGTFVARIPLSSLPEDILIRKALEETTSRMAAESATRSQVMALWAVLERQKEAGSANDHQAFHDADEAFHAMIAEVAGCPRFWTMAQQVKVQVDRYRRLTLPQAGRIPRLVEEHAAIVSAIEAHEPARAAASMALHLDGLVRDLSDIRHLNPDFFT